MATTKTTTKTTATKKPAAKATPTKATTKRGSDKGLLRRSTSRLTGTVVSVWDTKAAGLNDKNGELPYTVKCETHGKHLSTATRREAGAGRLNPASFCPTCKAASKRTGKKAA